MRYELYIMGHTYAYVLHKYNRTNNKSIAPNDLVRFIELKVNMNNSANVWTEDVPEQILINNILLNNIQSCQNPHVLIGDSDNTGVLTFRSRATRASQLSAELIWRNLDIHMNYTSFCAETTRGTEIFFVDDN